MATNMDGEQVLTPDPRIRPDPAALIAEVNFDQPEGGEPSVVVETQQNETEPTPSVDEDAQLASERGWVPEDKWTGPPEQWRDAKTFNRVYETRTLPRILQKDIKQLRQENEELRRKAAEWDKFRNEQTEARSKIRAETLKAERRRAIEENDTEALVRIDDELLDMRVAEKMRPVQTAPQIDPAAKMAYDEFLADNPSFGTDPDLRTELVAQAQTLRFAQSPLTGREFLEAAKIRVQRMLPDKFRPSRRPAMAETGGAPGGNGAGRRTWSDLKPEVAKALDTFISTTKGMTRENVLKSCSPDDFRR